MIISIISIFLISNVLAYPGDIDCNGTMIVNNGLSDIYYYPLNWNESIPTPEYITNQKCTWNIEIPDQKYAYFMMMADIDDGSSLVITDCNGKTETIMTSDQQPYVFVGTKFTIDLTIFSSGSKTEFGFRVQWIDFPIANGTLYSVSKGESALVDDLVMVDNCQTITAETRVSLVPFPAIWPDCTPYLRLSLVFDGPNMTYPYIGTLFQALRLSKPLVSSSNQVTVYTFGGDEILGPMYIAQDYYDVSDLSQIKGITCMSNQSCPVALTASNGPAVAMTLNFDDDDEFIKRLDLSTDSVLEVFIGTRKKNNNSNRIVSYDATTSKTNIPQKFNGDIMTYYLEQGTALVELAEDLNFTRWNDAAVGREGFITSKNYGFSSVIQNVNEYIGALEPNRTFSYTINVTYVDISNGSVLLIEFESENGIIEHKFSSENPSESTTFTEIASNMTVNYNTNGTIQSKGFYLDFKIGSASLSSTSQAGTFIVFLLISLSLI